VGPYPDLGQATGDGPGQLDHLVASVIDAIVDQQLIGRAVGVEQQIGEVHDSACHRGWRFSAKAAGPSL
jgi:hypothetical protein